MTSRTDVEKRGEHGAGDDTRALLLANLPVEERRLRLAGVSTAVLEGGSGRPVVLLHSSGEFGALWMRVIPDLCETNRVVVPDLPGHGASTVEEGPLDAAHMVAWLGELIERTCPSPPVVVGHGLGGAIAARYAVEHGDRVHQLVLLDSFGLEPFEPAPSFGLALNRYLEEPTEDTRDGLFAQCFVDPGRIGEQLGEGWNRIGAYALDRARGTDMTAALGSLMPHVGMPAIPEEDLARIATPTTLIWGRQDLQVRLRAAEAASARYGWPLRVVDGAGDDPPLEQPAAFLAALRGAIGAMDAMDAKA